MGKQGGGGFVENWIRDKGKQMNRARIYPLVGRQGDFKNIGGGDESYHTKKRKQTPGGPLRHLKREVILGQFVRKTGGREKMGKKRD